MNLRPEKNNGFYFADFMNLRIIQKNYIMYLHTKFHPDWKKHVKNIGKISLTLITKVCISLRQVSRKLQLPNSIRLVYRLTVKSIDKYGNHAHKLTYVYCVVFGGVNCLRSRPALHTAVSTQSTAHSHSTVKCDLSVMITKKFSLKMTQQGRNL
jgi:hypothetical protein